jgi:predicted ATPase
MRDFKSIQIHALGVNGENISSALFDLCKDPDKKISVVDWISELCAPEVSDIDFVKTEFDQVMFVLVEDNGRRISAKSVSDGTLRFLGQLVALLTAKAGALLLIEELENGLHPSRQSLLVEAIEGQRYT